MLTLALLFHFNQQISEHAYLASRACYHGLLQTLRARPAIKANIHISGTLLHALQWLDPQPLELAADGTVREIDSPEALKDYYGQQNPPIPWPYG